MLFFCTRSGVLGFNLRSVRVCVCVCVDNSTVGYATRHCQVSVRYARVNQPSSARIEIYCAAFPPVFAQTNVSVPLLVSTSSGYVM